MPYFFFHVKSASGTAMDREGSWFPDIWTAQQEATAAAREIVADIVRGGLDRPLPQTIVITELSGNKVATVHFKDTLPLLH
jgi:hypothetical protein